MSRNGVSSRGVAKLGYPVDMVVVIGAILLICVVGYVVPQTSIVGAVLLTGYPGGIDTTRVREHDRSFDTVFPNIFGILAWAEPFLRERRLRSPIPLRK